MAIINPCFFSQLPETLKTILLILYQVNPEDTVNCLKSAISLFKRFSFEYLQLTL